MPQPNYTLTDLARPIYRPKDLKDGSQLKASEVYYAEVKYDGHWTRLTNIGGPLRAHTRRVSKKAGMYRYLDLPQEILKSWAPDLPRDTCIDGELIVPGGYATDVSTYLKDPSLHGQLKFIGFAVPYYDGIECVDLDYREMAHQLTCVIPAACRALLSYQFPPGSPRSMIESHHRIHCDQNGPSEGFVLKGKGYDDWWKVKPTKTVDCVITAINMATEGKYAGLCGSLQLGAYNYTGVQLVDLGATSGMDDATRAGITKADIGRVVEIKYDSLASKGKLKFPRFLRFRDDKAAEECSIRQV